MSPAKVATAPLSGHEGLAARAAAVQLLSAVLDGKQALDAALERPELAGSPDPRDRALTRAIVGAALRHHGEIRAVLKKLILKKLPRRAGPLLRILETATAQILFLGVPDHAAVSTALLLAERDEDARHFKGLANAVLRTLARDRERLMASLDGPRVNTPDWLWTRWSRRYGAEVTHAMAAAHMVEPALDATVRADQALWAEKLGGMLLANGSVRCIAQGPVEALPGYDAGAWWVQDAAASLPARLLGDVAGKTVADLCAAPGGKTAQLAAAGAQVTALDRSGARLKRLAANLGRLGLSAEIAEADARQWRPEKTFDAVLLDAPCTATGTIRRHPDIPALKAEADIAVMAKLQSELLAASSDLTRPGGTLIFCTCSLEPEEGEDQARRAVTTLPLDPLPIALSETAGLGEVSPEGWLRTLPHHLAADNPRLAGLAGFFIARFRRR